MGPSTLQLFRETVSHNYFTAKNFTDLKRKKSLQIEPLDYDTPIPPGEPPYFFDGFKDRESLGKRWLKSEAKKDGVEDTIAKYDGAFRPMQLLT